MESHPLASIQMHLRGLVIFLAAVTFTISADPTPKVVSGSSVKWNRGSERFVIRATNAPLISILQEVSQQTGWEILTIQKMNERISVSINNEKSVDALKILLDGYAYTLLPNTGKRTRLTLYKNNISEAIFLLEPTPATSKIISNELVVVLKPGTDPDAIAGQIKAKVIGKIPRMGAYRFQFEDAIDAIAAKVILENIAAVTTIDSVYQISRPDDGDFIGQFGVPPFQLKVPLAGATSGLLVALIDTAIQSSAISFPDFLQPSVFIAGQPDLPNDRPTHGTVMAETLLRGISQANAGAAASQIRILPIDVYGNQERTTSFDIADGIYQAIAAKAQIINLSLGSPSESKLVHNLIKTGTQNGIVFIASAGNEPTTTPNYPAAHSEVYAVTASDSKGNLAYYANRGDFVDLIAPGVSPIRFYGKPFVSVGTSASAAYVSGQIAGLSVLSGKKPQQVGSSMVNIIGFRPPIKR